MTDEVEQDLKLDELAQAAGVSARTVRYYVQRGLLPAPVFRGRDTAYGREHLVRLRAIRTLQERHLPLDAIQSVLDSTSVAQLEKLGDATVEIQAPHTIVPSAPVARTNESTWRRIGLAPGLELHLSNEASERVRALANALVQWVKGRGP